MPGAWRGYIISFETFGWCGPRHLDIATWLNLCLPNTSRAV
jgi:hypothetical protein